MGQFDRFGQCVAVAERVVVKFALEFFRYHFVLLLELVKHCFVPTRIFLSLHKFVLPPLTTFQIARVFFLFLSYSLTERFVFSLQKSYLAAKRLDSCSQVLLLVLREFKLLLDNLKFSLDCLK